MSDFSDSVSSLIAAFGESVTFRKITPGTLNAGNLKASPTLVDYQIMASIRFYKPHEIAGLIQEGDRQVKIAGNDVTIAPTHYDKIIIAGKIFNVISVNARSTQGSVAAYIVQVRG